jgi:hypothetical protein
MSKWQHKLFIGLATTSDRKVLTVKTAYSSKSVTVPGRAAQEPLAHRLLQELVPEEKARKGSTL